MAGYNQLLRICCRLNRGIGVRMSPRFTGILCHQQGRCRGEALCRTCLKQDGSARRVTNMVAEKERDGEGASPRACVCVSFSGFLPAKER